MPVSLIYRFVWFTALALAFGATQPVQAADPKTPAELKQVAQPKLPAVLANVPADAAVVVVVPNMAGLGDKMAMLQKTLGIPIPQMANMVGQIKQMAQLEGAKGINESGSVAIIFADVSSIMGGIGGPSPASSSIVLVPVSDYGAFVKSLGGNESQAVAQIKLANEQAFAKKIGDYAVVGPNQQLVTEYKVPGDSGGWLKTVGTVGADSLSRSDMAVSIQMTQLAPVLQPLVATAMAEIQQTLTAPPAGVGGMDKSTIALLKAVAQGGESSVKALVRDTKTVTLGFDIDNYGVGLSASAQFKPDSQLAKIFTDGQGVSDVLKRLPLGNYVSASGSNSSGLNTESLTKELISRLPKDQKHWLIDLINVSMPMTELTKSTATADYMGGGLALGGSTTQGVTVIRTSDGKAYVEAYKKSLAKYNQIKIPVPAELMNMLNAGLLPGLPGGGVPLPPPGQAPGGNAPQRGKPAAPKTPLMTFKTTYDAAAVKLGDVSIDQYSVQINLPPEMMAQAGQFGPILAMAAGAPTNGYVTRIGDDVIMTNALDINLLKATMTMLKSGQGLGNDADILKIAKEQLPGNTLTENYWNVTPVVQMLSMMFPARPGQQIPAKLPPIAMATAAQDSGVALRIYVPMPVIVSIKNTANAVIGAMGGALPVPGPAPQPGGAPRRNP